MSKARPGVPILAFTPNLTTYQRLNMYWGVVPYHVPRALSVEEMLEAVEGVLLSSTPLEPGQQVVLICGYPINTTRPTNMALLHTIGETE